MSGERNLGTLLSSMSPSLHAQCFVYCCLHEGRLPEGLDPIGTFREPEGLTAVLLKEHALELGVAFQFECALLTLNVHSALDAVGLMAMVSSAPKSPNARAPESCGFITPSSSR